MKLTLPQIDLFHNLVLNEIEGRLFLPIRPIPANADEYVIYLRGKPNLRFRDFGDIDALCVVGLLAYKIGRMGASKEYSITKFGRTLFKSGTLTDTLELERINTLEQRTIDLRAALGYMMAGDALDRARADVDYVIAQLDRNPPKLPRIQLAMQRVNEMICGRFTYVTLEEAAHAASAFGDWCQAVDEVTR